MNNERVQWLPVNIPAVKAIADRAKQADELQTLVDAQAAELIKLRAQVAELGVTVEELQAMLRERNEDVKRKDAQIDSLRANVDSRDALDDIVAWSMTPPPHP